MATIPLRQVLREMEKTDERGRPVPFHIEVCTCDEARDSGGELISYSAAVLARSVRRFRAASTTSTKGTSAPMRPSNEWRNQTRNLSAVDSSEIRKACIWLITMFNHQTVVW